MQPLPQGQGLRGLTTSAGGVIALLFWGIAGGWVGVCVFLFVCVCVGALVVFDVLLFA